MITAGGPDMNDKGQVVNANGEAIPGLYQAGEIVGMANAFGRTTIGGVGNTGCLVWGLSGWRQCRRVCSRGITAHFYALLNPGVLPMKTQALLLNGAGLCFLFEESFAAVLQ